MKPTLRKTLSAFLISIVLFTVLPLPVFAQGAEENPCETGRVEECIYYNNKKANPQVDIRSTVSSMTTAGALYPITLATGYSLGQMTDCIWSMLKTGSLTGECGGLAQPQTSSRTSGTLLGLATKANEAAFETPIPVNLAYYGQYTASKIPALRNTAFAQSNPEYKNQPMLRYILRVWVVTRNLAYGALAVAMIIIGIMIMTRKEISPRVNVTVQNAIPRVILALILITFSYPIGALAASLTGPLHNVPNAIFSQIEVCDTSVGFHLPFGLEQILNGVLNFGCNALVEGTPFVLWIALAVISVATSLAGIGLVTGVILIVWTLLWLILWLTIGIKGLVITLKIIISIVGAPLTFAFGAIPGNESLTLNWFKTLGVRVASIPALYFGLEFAWYIVKTSLSSYFLDFNSTPDIGYVFSQLANGTLVAVVGPFLALWILFETTKIPRMMEEAFLDVKKGKRK